MLFNSTIFIALFLPLCLIGWYGLQQFKNPAWAKLFLVGMSLWFYGYYNPWYLLILVGSLLVNQGISTAMERLSGKGQETSAQAAGKVPGSRKLLLTLGLIANIGLLFYFKYFNFFVDNCNFFFHTDWQIEKLHCRWVSAFHIPADFLCGGPLQGRSALLQSAGLCLLCDIFSPADCGPHRTAQ